jgi:hypothetical protein
MSPLTMFGWWLLNVKQACHSRFFDAGDRRQAQGSGHECPNFICELAWIGSLFAHQDTDQGLANSADHQRNGEMRIDVIGNDAVTLGRLEHKRAGSKLSVGEGCLNIQDFGCAAQRPDDKRSERVVIVKGDVGGYSPLFSEGNLASLNATSSRRL